MPKVLCGLEACKYNRWSDEDLSFICEAETIEVYSEHVCNGGCDEGWVLPDEEEEGDEHVF